MLIPNKKRKNIELSLNILKYFSFNEKVELSEVISAHSSQLKHNSDTIVALFVFIFIFIFPFRLTVRVLFTRRYLNLQS